MGFAWPGSRSLGQCLSAHGRRFFGRELADIPHETPPEAAAASVRNEQLSGPPVTYAIAAACADADIECPVNIRAARSDREFPTLALADVQDRAIWPGVAESR